MITISTAELINSLVAVLPITLDPKGNPLAGVRIDWDGGDLHFTVYDVYAGAVVTWTPGEGAEEEIADDDQDTMYTEWGGEDEPWHVFISHADAKEIVKVFKLPSKLWRFPVDLKVNPLGTKLTVERNDSAVTATNRGERLLVVPSDGDVLAKIPDVRAMAMETAIAAGRLTSYETFSGNRLAALAPSAMYGVATLAFGEDYASITAGKRYAGFLYPAGANVRPFNRLRDGAGSVTSNV
jgi:hypothetical protein